MHCFVRLIHSLSFFNVFRTDNLLYNSLGKKNWLFKEGKEGFIRNENKKVITSLNSFFFLEGGGGILVVLESEEEVRLMVALAEAVAAAT